MTFMQIKNLILLVIAAVGAGLAKALGGWDSAMSTLIIIMAADYITGIMIAAVWQRSPKSEGGALESRAGFKGLCRKMLILISVLIAHQLDVSLHSPGLIRTAVILFFIGNEGLSVVENMGLMGVPLPDIVRKSFEQLKQKSGETVPVDDEEDGS
jgi:toxin secretion/phage lysis holin